MIEAFIGIGSNLTDRVANLRTALDLIAAEPAFLPRRASRLWETDPVGPPQPRYLNAAVQVGSLVSAKQTLRRLLRTTSTGAEACSKCVPQP